MTDVIKKNIGKNTIGDNKKMEVNLRTYNRSSHDLSYIWRNTQSAGTIVPFMCELALVEDTWEINLNSEVLTHPTTGPLYGSFKQEAFIFGVPHRLYNSWLHNNRTKIGLKMSDIKLPQLQFNLLQAQDQPTQDEQFKQINPSCLLAYLGKRGFGRLTHTTAIAETNAIPTLGYFDIFKNFFANKQEDNFYMITGGEKIRAVDLTPGGFFWDGIIYHGVRDQAKIQIHTNAPIEDVVIQWSYTGGIANATTTNATEFCNNDWVRKTDRPDYGDYWENLVNTTHLGLGANKEITIWRIDNGADGKLTAFPLEEIEEIRDDILATPGNVTLKFNTSSKQKLIKTLTGRPNNQSQLNTSVPQFGLCVKTYNSDLMNNWINTDWIDGENGINSISAVDVSDGSFTIDALNLAKKVYDMLNRIAVSGGTYKDWIETVYGSDYIERCETPTFEGGMSQEIVFQEVISNSATTDQPLGSLAGRGVTGHGQKGGKIKVRVTEPMYIIGVTAITPRIDYSQGNRFFTDHKTMDDMHKPQLDGIGYQDLITEEMAYWDTTISQSGEKTQYTAGKTVAWINYMTNYNRTFGNFAIPNSEAFMVLNRNYEMGDNGRISDLTTYIDPKKYNYVFADNSLSAMNFWVQIAVNITSRRAMSAKMIPNL